MVTKLKLFFLALVGVACLSFYHGVTPWVDWYGVPLRGTLTSINEIDYWTVVYHPNKDIVVDAGVGSKKFVPNLRLIDGGGNLVDVFNGQSGQTIGSVTMPPTVPETNLLRLIISTNEGTFPANYKVWKE